MPVSENYVVADPYPGPLTAICARPGNNRVYDVNFKCFDITTCV